MKQCYDAPCIYDPDCGWQNEEMDELLRKLRSFGETVKYPETEEEIMDRVMGR